MKLLIRLLPILLLFAASSGKHNKKVEHEPIEIEEPKRDLRSIGYEIHKAMDQLRGINRVRPVEEVLDDIGELRNDQDWWDRQVTGKQPSNHSFGLSLDFHATAAGSAGAGGAIRQAIDRAREEEEAKARRERITGRRFDPEVDQPVRKVEPDHFQFNAPIGATLSREWLEEGKPVPDAALKHLPVPASALDKLSRSAGKPRGGFVAPQPTSPAASNVPARDPQAPKGRPTRKRPKKRKREW